MGRRWTVIILLAAAAAALASCVQPAATGMGEASRDRITAVARSVTRASLESTLALFTAVRSVTANPTGILDAEADLVSGFQSLGYAVTTVPVTIQRALWFDPATETYSRIEGPFTMNNILAEKPGTDPSLRPVFVTAHHDTIPISPGVNDNGSGCAGVLEAARVLQAVSLPRTVRFIVFAFEEEGYLGSAAYADSLTDEMLPESVVNLETIGFTSAAERQVPLAGPLLGMPAAGDFVGVFGSYGSRGLVLDCLNAAATFVPDLPIFAASADPNLPSDPFLQDILRSDQTPFWDRGVPAVMVTDTANLRVGTPYHTEKDDLSQIDLDFLTSVVRTAVAVVCIRAGL